MSFIPPLGGGRWQFNAQIPFAAPIDYYLVDGAGHCWPDFNAANLQQEDFTQVGLGWVGAPDFPAGERYQVALFRADLRDGAGGVEPVLFGQSQLIRDLAGFTPTQMQLYATANGLAAFHLRFKFCSACAGVLEIAEGGWARKCSSCGLVVYPRQDPAVIVTIFDADNNLLLAHNAGWPVGRVSLIAGFINMGESAEQAVCREVFEEVGLVIDPRWVRYVTTQTWPFPQSLMLAYEVRVPFGCQDLVPQVDGVEIEWAQWFSLSSYRSAVAEGVISGPVNHSVAAALVGRWLSGVAPVS